MYFSVFASMGWGWWNLLFASPFFRFNMDTKKIVRDMIRGLQNSPYQDLSDVGNIIGIALGKNDVPKVSKDGNDLIGFNFGINHGMDLTLPLSDDSTCSKLKWTGNGTYMPSQ